MQKTFTDETNDCALLQQF